MEFRFWIFFFFLLQQELPFRLRFAPCFPAQSLRKAPYFALGSISDRHFCMSDPCLAPHLSLNALAGRVLLACLRFCHEVFPDCLPSDQCGSLKPAATQGSSLISCFLLLSPTCYLLSRLIHPLDSSTHPASGCSALVSWFSGSGASLLFGLSMWPLGHSCGSHHSCLVLT
jgi:hypothetical protein